MPRRARTLIVEDEQIIAADLETMLTRLGHEIVGIAASGEESLRLAEELRPELVFMDIQLQGRMEGTEAARRIQEQTGAQIIFLTAFAGVFLKNPSQMAAPGVCLSKPFTRYQLKSALDSVLAPLPQ